MVGQDRRTVDRERLAARARLAALAHQARPADLMVDRDRSAFLDDPVFPDHRTAGRDRPAAQEALPHRRR